MMEEDIVIKTDSAFLSINYESDTECWNLFCDDAISFRLATFWRLLKDERIKLVSLDNGIQFGLPKPLDIPFELSSILTGEKLIEIKIKKNTGDILLIFTNKFQIEIFITSGGWESYHFIANSKSYIGLGMGEVAMY